jgi:hypothetical protein
VGGPWFTVLENGDDWHHFSDLWLSNGERSIKARMEIQIRLEGPQEHGAHE